jgi:hypothetical protein
MTLQIQTIHLKSLCERGPKDTRAILYWLSNDKNVLDTKIVFLNGYRGEVLELVLEAIMLKLV